MSGVAALVGEKGTRGLWPGGLRLLTMCAALALSGCFAHWVQPDDPMQVPMLDPGAGPAVTEAGPPVVAPVAGALPVGVQTDGDEVEPPIDRDDEEAAVTVPDAGPVGTRDPVDPSLAESIRRLLLAARSQLGSRRVRLDGRSFRADCSGFVRGAFGSLGIDVESLPPPPGLSSGVSRIWRFADMFGVLHRKSVPAPGDLVFFHNTHDRNHNRRLDDRWTHIGIVDTVLGDGTFLVLHRSHRGVVREPMNIRTPSERFDVSGNEINARLRRIRRRDVPGTGHLMGELFAGFGTIRWDSIGSLPALPPPRPSELREPPLRVSRRGSAVRRCRDRFHCASPPRPIEVRRSPPPRQRSRNGARARFVDDAPTPSVHSPVAKSDNKNSSSRASAARQRRRRRP